MNKPIPTKEQQKLVVLETQLHQLGKQLHDLKVILNQNIHIINERLTRIEIAQREDRAVLMKLYERGN